MNRSPPTMAIKHSMSRKSDLYIASHHRVFQAQNQRLFQQLQAFSMASTISSKMPGATDVIC
jgi:hypothetical protein